MGKLVIRAHETLKAKTEKLSDFEESYFRQKYLAAIKCVNDIVDANNRLQDGEEQNGENYNNIIAFTGERGTGKTSCMISFKESLVKKSTIDEVDKLKDELNTEYKKAYKDKHYHSLDTIDPSMFSDKDSIIEIIVGMMFAKFKTKTNIDDYEKKKRLIKNFENVYRNIRILNADKNSVLNDNTDNLEVLMDLSSAISLKANLQRLIKSYMNYFYSDNNPKYTYLIIAIDDLDMNLQAGDKMLEEIRKYLIIPGVIILMAIKMEQLEQVVMQRHLNQLHVLSQYYMDIYDKKESDDAEIERYNTDIQYKTYRYLNKLVPSMRRIYMPNLLQDNPVIEIRDNDESILVSGNVQNLLREYVNQKTTYKIVTQEHTEALVGNNLRSYVQAIKLLMFMPIPNSYKDIKVIIENLNTFKTTVIAPIVNQLKEYGQSLTLLLECKKDEINKVTFFELNSRLNKKINIGNVLERGLDKSQLEIDEYTEYIDSIKIHLKDIESIKGRTKKQNIHMGDIISWLTLYKQCQETKEDGVVYELIKSIYTIRLLELYYDKDSSLNEIIGKDMIGQYLYIKGSEFERYKSIYLDEYYKNKVSDKLKVPSEINELIEEDYTPNVGRWGEQYYRLLMGQHKASKGPYIKPFNLIGNKVIELLEKDLDTTLLYIINLDCYIEILDRFNDRLQETTFDILINKDNLPSIYRVDKDYMQIALNMEVPIGEIYRIFNDSYKEVTNKLGVDSVYKDGLVKVDYSSYKISSVLIDVIYLSNKFINLDNDQINNFEQINNAIDTRIGNLEKQISNLEINLKKYNRNNQNKQDKQDYNSIEEMYGRLRNTLRSMLTGNNYKGYIEPVSVKYAKVEEDMDSMRYILEFKFNKDISGIEELKVVIAQIKENKREILNVFNQIISAQKELYEEDN